MELIILVILLIIIGIIGYNKYYPNQKVQEQEEESNLAKTSDRFEDGLDNPYGIKKQNRHHSF